MADEVLDLEVARNKMKEWRDEPPRNSEEVIELGESLIVEHGSKLGDELWSVYEQVLIAALDLGKTDLASMCLKALSSQFPGSLRVKRLIAMKHEALNQFDKATEMYDDMIAKEPANSAPYKRKISILVGQNKISEAVKALNDYLKRFMSDHEAWGELTDLYISQQEFSKAAFCMEELIISNPHNHLFYQKYAEILYTMRGVENLEKSRSYFSQALRLDNNNMRALYGFFMAASSLANMPKAKNKKENAKYASWAASQIMEKYQTANKDGDYDCGKLSSIENLLDSLQLTAPSDVPH
ncbi:ER membrane protein complex subunit 2-like [Dendronephthya gigantea]|uniref:ER membrane protein complex subunit 2-like n=1 Tax=Dendronephthya gigantea TaxID=151771 RepID=UPI00106C7D7A|nr:ER membrane protein complex subunit 2-like [Dendronephthya gigantea]XP_028404970.1 ER membrane protein complex subunit 2-like [Dendronephthya gigantea]